MTIKGHVPAEGRASVWRRIAGLHRPLVTASVAAALLTVITFAATMLDSRTLLGEPIWLKPFKFSVSITLYAVTLAWMISFLNPVARRWAWWIGSVIAVLLGVEMVVIILQVIRGQRSHFNIATTLNQDLYIVMGVSIAVVWALNLILAVFVVRERIEDTAIRLAIRSGLVIALAGMAVAFFMVLPTGQQVSAIGHGAAVPFLGAHSVGVPDGSPGIPLTGWNLTGGDLRAPHFLGLHGLQALPLLAIALQVLAGRWVRLRSEVIRARLVATGAFGYGGLFLLTSWQALRGQSLVRPDALTLGVAAALIVGVIVGVALAFRNPTT